MQAALLTFLVFYFYSLNAKFAQTFELLLSSDKTEFGYAKPTSDGGFIAYGSIGDTHT